MNDSLSQNTLSSSIPGAEKLQLADVTHLYVELANRVAENTRMNTDELSRIIASMHQANQAY